MRKPRGVQSPLSSACLMVVKFLRDFCIAWHQLWRLELYASERPTLILAPLIDLNYPSISHEQSNIKRLTLQVAGMKADRAFMISVSLRYTGQQRR